MGPLGPLSRGFEQEGSVLSLKLRVHGVGRVGVGGDGGQVGTTYYRGTALLQTGFAHENHGHGYSCCSFENNAEMQQLTKMAYDFFLVPSGMSWITGGQDCPLSPLEPGLTVFLLSQDQF